MRPLTIVLDAIWPGYTAFTMAAVCLPVAIIGTIGACHASLALALIMLEFTRVDMPVLPALRAVTLTLTFLRNCAHVLAAVVVFNDGSVTRGAKPLYDLPIF